MQTLKNKSTETSHGGPTGQWGRLGNERGVIRDHHMMCRPRHPPRAHLWFQGVVSQGGNLGRLPHDGGVPPRTDAAGCADQQWIVFSVIRTARSAGPAPPGHPHPPFPPSIPVQQPESIRRVAPLPMSRLGCTYVPKSIKSLVLWRPGCASAECWCALGQRAWRRTQGGTSENWI